MLVYLGIAIHICGVEFGHAHCFCFAFQRLENPLFAPINMCSAQPAWIPGFDRTHFVQRAVHLLLQSSLARKS